MFWYAYTKLIYYIINLMFKLSYKLFFIQSKLYQNCVIIKDLLIDSRLSLMQHPGQESIKRTDYSPRTIA